MQGDETGQNRAAAPDDVDQTPLVVDLDGTLIRTDSLHEALIRLVATQPGRALSVLPRILRGKPVFKAAVADHQIIAAETLVLNQEVLDQVAAARADGRRTLLVTASDARQAEEVARATGLFDEAIGTGSPETGGINLSGKAKAAYLTKRFGKGGFDYMGNARDDAAVWAQARRAVTVTASGQVRALAERSNASVTHIDPAAAGFAKLNHYIRAMRPRQWVKNILVFLPAIAAHSPEAFLAAVFAFVAFSLTASSVYLLNDLLDLEADRAHPRKRLRPFAAGDVPIAQGAIVAFVLLLAAFLFSLVFTPPAFLLWLGIYYVTTFAYSFWIKRRLIVDVVCLAGLYTLRIIAGAAVAAIVLSPWMLGFSMFLFLALAAVKRQAELEDMLSRNRSETAGRAYTIEDLPILRGVAISASHTAVMVYALYVTSRDVQQLYGRPELLWLNTPLILYWLIRMVMKTHRGLMTDDPIVFASRDKVSLGVIVACGLIVLAAAAL